MWRYQAGPSASSERRSLTAASWLVELYTKSVQQQASAQAAAGRLAAYRRTGP
jgi:hypothetical protein